MTKPPIEKIDTQGMSGPATPEAIARAKTGKHKPALKTPRRILTPTDVKEFKILI